MPELIIGVPTQRGQIEPEFFHAMLSVRTYLHTHGVPHNVLSNECSVISAGRNAIATMFIHNTNADLFMFIDSDIQFPPYGVNRLISRDKDIIGGVYYHKDGTSTPTIYKFNDAGCFRCYSEFDKMDQPFEVDGIGTGFLLIKRHVLEKFAQPEITKELGTPFGFGYAPNGVEEGEDLAFCRRAKKLGFQIWADPTVPLFHIGKVAYTRDNFMASVQFSGWKHKYETYDNQIDGWMTKSELNWLNKMAEHMDNIVEIGSWKGRSTHALLSGCKGPVYAIDTWKGTEGEPGNPHIEAKEHDVFNDCFMKNVGDFPNLRPMQMTSLEAASLFEDNSVDMVFIDGDHSYNAVKADIEAWMPKAKKLVCGHDYQWHTVQEAVTEKFGEPDLADNIWIHPIGDFKKITGPLDAEYIFMRRK